MSDKMPDRILLYQNAHGLRLWREAFSDDEVRQDEAFALLVSPEREAAPELLEVLKEIRDTMDEKPEPSGGEPDFISEAYNIAEKAIAAIEKSTP